MKKLIFSLLALGCIAPAITNAQVVKPHSLNNRQNAPAPRNPIDFNQKLSFPTFDVLPLVENKETTTQALTYTTLFRESASGIFGIGAAHQQPIVYHAPSGILGVVQNARTGTGNVIGVTLQLRYSTNAGANWVQQPRVIYTSPVNYVGMPQIAIGSPTPNATTLSTLSMLAVGNYYPQSSGYTRTNIGLYASIGGQNSEIPILGPQINNDQGDYQWGSGNLYSYTSPNGSGFTWGNTLDPISSNVQYGQHGLLAFKAAMETDDDLITTIPSAWGASQFRDPGTKASSYNSPIYVDADNDGILYAVTSSIFADDIENRTPSISKSTDGGKVWSAFSRMPVSTLTAYAEANGANLATILRPYEQNSMVVTGTDKVSYFTRLGLFSGSGMSQTLTSFNLVEIIYNNGAWSVNTIAKLNDIPATYLYQDSITSANGFTEVIALVVESAGGSNSAGNEVEAARTADGTQLVVKWVDANPNRVTRFNPPLNIRKDNINSEATLDSLVSTDIFMASRPVEATSWSLWGTNGNVTDDDHYDKSTHIPHIIPNISTPNDRVPLISNRGLADSEWATNPTGTALKNANDVFIQALIDLPQNISFARVSGVTSVENERTPESYGFSMGNPQPNPAVNEFGFTVTTENGGYARIVIYNSLGQEVKTLFNSMMTPGINGFTFQTGGLPQGSYTVALTVNGTTTVRHVAVIR